MWSDAEVTRFIGGKPLSGEEVWARILRYAGHWSMLGYGYWLIEEKATGPRALSVVGPFEASSFDVDALGLG